MHANHVREINRGGRSVQQQENEGMEGFLSHLQQSKKTTLTYTSSSAVNRWINKYPDFAKQIIQARKVGCQYYLDKMIEELETMSAKDVGIVREKLQHYRWMASKLLPSLYGDKQEVIQDTKITIQWQQPEQMKVVEPIDR